MLDSTFCTLPLATRPERLLQYQRLWRNAEWTTSASVQYPILFSPEDAVVLNATIKVEGTVLGVFSSRSRDLCFIQIPSRTRGLLLRKWTVNLHDIERLVKIGFDPLQNLLVTLETANQNSTSHLMFRCLTDGMPHPLADRVDNVPINAFAPNDVRTSQMTIYNHFVALSLAYRHNRILVWNWHTGDVVKDLTTPSGMGGECVFISDRYILLGKLEISPPSACLYVVDVQGAGDAIVCTLRLPRLARFNQGSITIQSSHYASGSTAVPQDTPFVVDSAEKLIFVTIITSETLGLFFLTSGILDLVCEVETRRGRHVVEWDDWGPDHTRLSKLGLPNIYCVGTKAFAVQNDTLVLYDLNQRLIKRELAIAGDPGDQGSEIVAHPTKSINWKSFVDDVTTCLPYRSTTVTVTGIKDRQWKRVVSVEDGVVIIPMMHLVVNGRCGIKFCSI
ncbi:hypothetical protein AX17_003909 [Amanita inopinata Kibby_2008]|nr:hypothetical protein AX17_003909 [Amanita inopinata Kibby_2008]